MINCTLCLPNVPCEPRLDKNRSPKRSWHDLILHDAFTTVFNGRNALQSVPDELCFMNGIALPFCISVIIYSKLRPCLGLRPDQ